MATGIQTSVQRGRRSGIVGRQNEDKPWDRALKGWQGLSSARRYAALSIIGVLLLASILAAGAAKSNRHRDLYPLKLTAEDVREISMVLTDLRIAHTVAPTQDGILLHPSDRARAQAHLAALSLPRHRSPNAPSEDSSSFDTVDERREAAKARLEAELVQTLRQMEGVHDARIRLAIPPKTYFNDDQKSVKASLFLKLDRTFEMDAGTARGIASLVAHSVPELKEENVSILDHTGHEIKVSDDPETLELEMQARWEAHLQDKLQTMLRHIYGDRVHASVNLTLDFSQEEIRRYTPGSPADDGRVKDSFQLVHEMLEGASLEEDKKYEQRKEAVNYTYTENYFAKLREKAKVERLTATVLIDGAGEQEVAEVKRMVMGAVGIDQTRADEVFVSGLPWDHDPAEVWGPKPVEFEQDEDLDLYSVALAFAVGMLLAVGAGALLVRKTMPILPVDLGTGAPHPANTIVDHHHDKHGSRSQMGATATRGTRLEALEQMVGSKPDRVATFLRSTWLS